MILTHFSFSDAVSLFYSSHDQIYILHFIVLSQPISKYICKNPAELFQSTYSML